MASAKDLVDLGNRLFSKRRGLDELWQEIALNFYPERADFTGELVMGEEFSAHLMDSFPLLLRRELGNMLSSMLRPRGTQWFKMTTQRDELDEVPEHTKWLEAQSQMMRRAMYDRPARFVRATKEADHDWVSFGQAVISVEEAPTRDHLLYRNWHLRDCTWLENDVGEVDHLHRKMKMQARQIVQRWGKNQNAKVHRDITQAAEKEPDQPFEIRHVVMPAEELQGSDKAKGGPFASVYTDVTNEEIIFEGSLPTFQYVVPRWQTVSGSQYAFSPATVISLPDGRLIQDQARTLLEAGEKGVDPPMAATQQALRSDVDIRAGALTWIDAEYDERLGDALRPLHFNPDMRSGIELRRDIREMLTRAWFIDKLTLPEAGANMTAFEVGRRLEEFVRNALPLFEPMEVEYNAQLLERTWDILSLTEAVNRDEIPEQLQDQEIAFAFDNPLQEAEGRKHVAQFSETLQVLAAGREAGATANPVKVDDAMKDAITGTGSPADWMKDDDELEADADEQEQAAGLAEAAAVAQEGAAVAGDVADSTTKLREAGLL